MEMAAVRILHISSTKALSLGQRKQLIYERQADTSPHFQWHTKAIHTKPPQTDFEIRVPKFLRFRLGRNLYVWIQILNSARHYDIVIVRYVPFDIFLPLLGWFVPNRISYHHSMEINELRLIDATWRGRVATYLEAITGWFNARQVIAFLGVTHQIARFNADLYGVRRPYAAFPNSVDMSEIPILEDFRDSDVHIAFMCGVFTQWHGLDRLLLSIRDTKDEKIIFNGSIHIHLVGRLLPHHLAEVNEAASSDVRIWVHGQLPSEQYREIFAKCDIGISSLALDRQGMSESSSLKVSEYLALGLPVYAGSPDAALPQEFPYQKVGPADIRAIVKFAFNMKNASRKEVRAAGAPYIGKTEKMEAIASWLKTMQGQRKSLPVAL